MKAKTVGASVNDLLLTACYRSYAKTNHLEGAMSVSGMVDLRQHCKDGTSEGLSNMSGGLSSSLEYASGDTFTDNLAEVARQTMEAKHDPLVGLDGIPMIHTATKTVPMWVLLKAAGIVYSSLSLWLPLLRKRRDMNGHPRHPKAPASGGKTPSPPGGTVTSSWCCGVLPGQM